MLYSTVRPYHFHSYTPPPPVLSICQELRQGGLKFYSLDFGVEDFCCFSGNLDEKFPFLAPAKININWNADRVCIFHASDLIEVSHYRVDFTRRSMELRDRFIEKCLRYLALAKFEGMPMDFAKDLIPTSSNNEHFEELIMYQGSGLGASFHRPGNIKFKATVPDDRNHLMLCCEIPVEYFRCQSGQAPMLFNLRIADIQFEGLDDMPQTDTAITLISKGDIWKVSR